MYKRQLHGVLEGVALLVGAFFFMVPGAITDLAGICLIIPQLRRLIIRTALDKIIVEIKKRELRR